ncbi:MAG TPA: nitrate reductase molybdenum cofactor assembly chaperone [Thiobacillus sp.]|nr:MAG: nitrate reductase molybdenum cofactor assembly chaperone [Hydrogenophilales bacterium 28-61-11]OYZ58311.1 MAG: nitrate reductase molybdenum cofactor assembly chaperone [Hydrogenophilales bacterium 16-61-112]OZA44890.1 MAG: nitrate reductase molybdenum cofactor assembly chaperone [Hydrogenophilales bacterium 17-61-76]HQT35119.1 nitrate reductase molybdenum cofactor assembly chaperone [Thiobacillus sp.]HQT70334.1 nitrate reductase molybdenum cofactor assembly chaperone [Thiobacillus sp.]
MKTFKVLSILLTYPESDWLAALPELEAALATEADINGEAHTKLAPLFALLRESTLIELQENYVATFDRNPSHSLHLFEHIHGESRDRGSAMIDLLSEYWKYDFDASASELPDYVPLFLEFLSLLPAGEALELLGDAVHVLATIGRKLDANGSPYATAFQLLEALSPVAALELAEPPVRDMDEAMELFGPSADGVEPLMNPGPQVSVVQMPKPHRQAAA